MDKYDKAIEFLTEHPDAIPEAWNSAETTHPIPPIVGVAGCLFRKVAPQKLKDNKKPLPRECLAYGLCGCLTQVKSGDWEAFTPELTRQIRDEAWIPTDGYGITVEMLPKFAEWQRKLDVLFANEDTQETPLP